MCTKWRGKERLVEKKKRRGAERLMTCSTLGLGTLNWEGMASLEPARRARSVAVSVRADPPSHLSHISPNSPHISPRFGNFIFSNNSIPLVKRLNDLHVTPGDRDSDEKKAFPLHQIIQIRLDSDRASERVSSAMQFPAL